jgi:hypothetical protein
VIAEKETRFSAINVDIVNLYNTALSIWLADQESQDLVSFLKTL